MKLPLNNNLYPHETLSPFKTSGTVSERCSNTARGFGEKESRQVAELIIKALKNAENEAVLEEAWEVQPNPDRCLPIIRPIFYGHLYCYTILISSSAPDDIELCT